MSVEGGNATLLHTPDEDLRGNSHMMMQDRNNLQIADLMIKWIMKQSPSTCSASEVTAIQDALARHATAT